MTFLLYEIEFGNESYVDELIMKRISTEPVEKVLILIIQQATEISLDAARSVLRRMIHYDNDRDVTKKILSANMDFEMKNGNSATVAEVNMLRIRFLTREELAREELANTSVKPVTPVAAPIKNPADLVMKPVPLVKPVTSVVKPITSVQAQKTPVLKSPVVHPVTPVVKPKASVKPVELNTSKGFQKFRSMLLEPIGICPEEIDNPDVKAIEEYTGDESDLIQLCENILEKHQNSFVIIKIVSKKFWVKQMYENLRELLANAKDFCEEIMLENLIVLYNIKTDILQGNVNKIIKKLALHINAINTTQMLNLFVDLANENDRQISKVFERCLTDPTISLNNKKLISLQYVNYSLKFDKDVIIKKADGYFLKFHQPFKAYHCEEELKKIENGPKIGITDVKKYLTSKKFSFIACVQTIRSLYANKCLPQARTDRNTCCQKFIKMKESLFKFTLLTTLLESEYGQISRALKWLNVMEKTNTDNMNLICLRADIYLKNKELKRARSALAPYIVRPNVIMNPEVQKLLFMYSNNWKIKYNIDLFPKLLKQLIEQGGADDDVT